LFNFKAKSYGTYLVNSLNMLHNCQMFVVVVVECRNAFDSVWHDELLYELLLINVARNL